jgi:hypothetical protein
LRRIEDHLYFAIAVAEIDEDQSAVIAAAVDPAADRHCLVYLFRPQLAARVCPQQVNVLRE